MVDAQTGELVQKLSTIQSNLTGTVREDAKSRPLSTSPGGEDDRVLVQFEL